MKTTLWALGILTAVFTALAFASPSPIAAGVATICFFGFVILGLFYWLRNSRSGDGKMLKR
jgi:O-antigen/teichoic acid export membrane protein